MSQCHYCKSTELISDVQVKSLDMNVPGKIQHQTGLQYVSGEIHWLLKEELTTLEPLLAEVCKQCGTVRLYIHDTSRVWCIKE